MLTVFPPNTPEQRTGVVWFDLCAPTPAEIAEVEQRTGVTLPRRDALGEIERSSRLQRRDGVLVMSTPTATLRTLDALDGAPLGFLLGQDWLVTLRYAPLPAFEAVHRQLQDSGAPDGGGRAVFAALCEEIVADVADRLEHTAAELGTLSAATFRDDDGQARHAVRSNRLLRAQLRQVGRLNDRLTAVRDGLLGLERVLAFAGKAETVTNAPDLPARLASVREDITALLDVGEHLTAKVQFILDAQVGLIGIAQNDIFKILTIVSIAGIAPTLIAGVYGMNFKFIPEYDWRLGYPYSLLLMALSAVLPLVWFKRKDWF